MDFVKNVGRLSDISIVPCCKCHFKWIVIIGKKPEKSELNNTICLNGDEFYNQLHLAECTIGNQALSQQVLHNNIVEIYLGNVFTEKTTALMPELFKCVNVQVLSLRKNSLVYLPADVGRLSKLRTLILTENFLTVQSIPYTLTFCKHLRTLHLDHNFLDGLPGFLLEMPHLETVYRHGNHNYFKSTFLWFHSSKQERVIPLITQPLKSEESLHQPHSLQTHSILSVISSKVNFFEGGLLPVTVQEHISRTYLRYRICAYCSKAFCQGSGGFKVFTFKNPYLGNTCVPFQHFACSRECGILLETPAEKQEHEQACEADRDYQQYTTSVQQDVNLSMPNRNRPPMPSCVLM